MATTLDEVAGSMRQMADSGRAIAIDSQSTDDRPPLDIMAERLLQQRHARSRFLPPSLFHEPAWEILLSLFVAQRRGKTLNVKHLVDEVDAPVTTSQRWIDTLAHMKLVQRFADPNDRRRIELSLSDTAVLAVERYLQWHLDPANSRLAPEANNSPRLA
jgi:DNA-binding MarR family transcriptional regulator